MTYTKEETSYLAVYLARSASSQAAAQVTYGLGCVSPQSWVLKHVALSSSSSSLVLQFKFLSRRGCGWVPTFRRPSFSIWRSTISAFAGAPMDAVLRDWSGVLCLLGEILYVPEVAPLESRTLGLGVICVPMSLFEEELWAVSVPNSLTDMELGKSDIDLECGPNVKMSARQPADKSVLLRDINQDTIGRTTSTHRILTTRRKEKCRQHALLDLMQVHNECVLHVGTRQNLHTFDMRVIWSFCRWWLLCGEIRNRILCIL